MKIIAVECFPLKIKPAEVYLGSPVDDVQDDYYYRPEYRCVYSRKMETCLVKITADDGHVGWGEALAPVIPQVIADIITALFTPLLPEDVADHAALRQKSAIPIALGETERTRYQFRPFIERQAVDILQPDVGRTGITELMHIASLAETWNLKVAPHLSVGLAPCIAASLQMAAALPNLYLLEFQPPVFALANSLLKTPLVRRTGAYQLPSGPGLGIEVDEQRVREYCEGKVC